MEQNLYEKLGKEECIRQLVKMFYQYMDTLPEAQGVREMHPSDLTISEEKLYEFLVGWSGGPPLFVSKYGHPRLRARHLPFRIGESERDQWMLCMRRALEDCVTDPTLHAKLESQLYNIADFMRNV